jgi:uncharacterized protein YndB with AHSA1/START domain
MSVPDGKSLAMSWEIPHPPAKVWRALTESDLLAKWIMSNDMKPIVGHKFTFRTEPTPWWDGIVYCEVLAVESPKLLKYSWQGNKDGSGRFGLDTVVVWTLQALGARGTTLSIEQSGFPLEASQAYHGAQKGWGRNIDTLIELLKQE